MSRIFISVSSRIDIENIESRRDTVPVLLAENVLDDSLKSQVLRGISFILFQSEIPNLRISNL